MSGTQDEVKVLFERLGESDGVGKAFAITRKASLSFGSDARKRWPRVAYPHRIYRDMLTDNYIVVRANADGSFIDMDEIGQLAYKRNRWKPTKSGLASWLQVR